MKQPVQLSQKCLDAVFKNMDTIAKVVLPPQIAFLWLIQKEDVVYA